MAEYLDVVLPGGGQIGGGGTVKGYSGDFTVTSADSGPSYDSSSGDTIFQPFSITLESAATGDGAGINALLAAASAGTSPLTLTLYTTSGGGDSGPTVTTGQITLNGATIVAAQTAGGGTVLSLDYSSITVTPYTQNNDGSYSMGTPVTTTVPDTASFAAPTQASLSLYPPRETQILNVSDDPGPGQMMGFTSDFQPVGYQFAVGANGEAGPLVIDFGAKSDQVAGVAQLDSDLMSNQVIPSLTLYTVTNKGVTTDQETFTNAVVSSYTDTKGDVTVTFDFQSATLESIAEEPDGSYVVEGSTTIPGDILPCYLRGTRIRTPRGEIAVENLERGDLVVTASGDSRPIVWLGSRRVDCARHRDPAAVWPVRIRAGALGSDQPARDLWVSPGHSLLMDGSLVQAERLINGATIERVELPRVEYWHVELDTHDVLLAEGAPAESYLDTGNRSSFSNGGNVLDAHPDFAPKHWSDTCAPLLFDGPALEKLRTALLQPALALGYVLSDDAGLHVLADGERIEPIRLGATRVAFLIPEGRSSIQLRSRTFIPAQTCVASGDIRELGVCVGRLQVDGTEMPLASEAAYASGWHSLETHADGSQQRWSKAATPLPSGSRLVVLDIVGRSYCWEPPPANVTAINEQSLTA